MEKKELVISEQIQTEERSPQKKNQNQTSAPGRFRGEQWSSVFQGLAGQRRAIPVLPSIRSRLCGILSDHSSASGGKKPYSQISIGPRCFPITSILISTFLLPSPCTCKGTHPLAQLSGALILTAASKRCSKEEEEELPLLIRLIL